MISLLSHVPDTKDSILFMHATHLASSNISKTNEKMDRIVSKFRFTSELLEKVYGHLTVSRSLNNS